MSASSHEQPSKPEKHYSPSMPVARAAARVSLSPTADKSRNSIATTTATSGSNNESELSSTSNKNKLKHNTKVQIIGGEYTGKDGKIQDDLKFDHGGLVTVMLSKTSAFVKVPRDVLVLDTREKGTTTIIFAHRIACLYDVFVANMHNVLIIYQKGKMRVRIKPS